MLHFNELAVQFRTTYAYNRTNFQLKIVDISPYRYPEKH